MTDRSAKALDAAMRIVALCDVLGDLAGSDPETFLADVRTQWAVEMGLIRIGETVARIPDEVLARFPGQPWRQIVAMRNFAAHQYDDLDAGRVWRTVTADVPRLRAYLVDVVIPGLRPQRPRLPGASGDGPACDGRSGPYPGPPGRA